MGHLQPLAALGALRQMKRYSTIANNMSNSQTVGFKKDNLVFKNAIEKASNQAGNEEGDMSLISFEQGELQRTGNPLDVAINGEGFFKIKTPQGMRYTRVGKFELTGSGLLVNGKGFPVMGRSGEITLTGRNVFIDRDGSIQMDGSTVDQLSVVTLPNRNLLKKEGETLMRLDVPQEEAEGSERQVIQGTLESSNVNVVQEMMRMMDALRNYQSCMKVIESNDELNAKAVNELARI